MYKFVLLLTAARDEQAKEDIREKALAGTLPTANKTKSASGTFKSAFMPSGFKPVGFQPAFSAEAGDKKDGSDSEPEVGPPIPAHLK